MDSSQEAIGDEVRFREYTFFVLKKPPAERHPALQIIRMFVE